VVEGARLESVYTGNRIEGSNPSPSASVITQSLTLLDFLIENRETHNVTASAAGRGNQTDRDPKTLGAASD
jgi:hypothetical protein